jgi:hypothetical protein
MRVFRMIYEVQGNSPISMGFLAEHSERIGGRASINNVGPDKGR